MLNRWKLIDILIAVWALLTALSYFVSKSVFKLLFWLLVIILIARIVSVLRRKFFWKIRNRLIFSSIFLVVTPIFFVTFFFLLIGNVFVAQYGLVLIDNIMNDRLNRIEETAKSYLKYSAPHLMIADANQNIRYAPNLNVMFWENRNNNYKPVFRYPDTLSQSKIPIDDFKGYFMLENKLYHGVLKKNKQTAVLFAFEINQWYLDRLYDISDFKIKFRNPNQKKIVNEKDDKSQAEANSGIQSVLPTDTVTIPYLFEYSYLDFDNIKDSKPVEKRSDFLMTNDSDRVYKKLNSSFSSTSQGSIKNIINAFIVLFSTFIVVSLLIGFRMIRVITRSIDQLTRGTQRIRNGDFSFRIKTRSGDQMQYLAECFNEMAAGIDRLLIDEKEKQRLEEELRIARSIQLKLLPPESLNIDEFEIAAVNIPAEEIAGDYFDYFYKPGAYLSLLVADVSGKGASAAFYMAELKGVINHLHRALISPATLISECHYSLKDTFDRVTFITMNIAQFRMSEKKFILARAGHTPAIFYNSKENKCVELQPDGMAIGLINFSFDKLNEVELPYQKGDILMLFSDGLTEIMDEEEEMLGINRLKQVILENKSLSVEDIKKKILDFSIEFSGAAANRDDLTFILLKVK